ncbi:hypothetical protein ACJRO7_017264 [Eucalyptus globulus]|uniref:HTH myb-type domain-containing protein n=1 Tax=Eucalyptus globulus TaxID=34317 RepID=A0ABD3KTZ1_EUCGL
MLRCEDSVEFNILDVGKISEESKLDFFEYEEMLIIRIQSAKIISFMIRWSLIANRIPGRTDEEIEKYWNSRYSTSQ